MKRKPRNAEKLKALQEERDLIISFLDSIYSVDALEHIRSLVLMVRRHWVQGHYK